MEMIDMATDDVSSAPGGEANSGPGNDNPFDSARKMLGDTAANFTEQAGAKARDYAAQGKDRAVDALDNVADLVEDAAAQVGEKLGDQYGGYIRQAADAVSGLANTLREKEADDLLEDARNVVRSSPAVAVAAAAAVGFLLARVVKSGLTPRAGNDATESTSHSPRRSGAERLSTSSAAETRGSLAAPEVPETPVRDVPSPPEAPAADGAPSVA